MIPFIRCLFFLVILSLWEVSGYHHAQMGEISLSGLAEIDDANPLIYSKEIVIDKKSVGVLVIMAGEDPTFIIWEFLSAAGLYTTERVEQICNEIGNCPAPIILVSTTVRHTGEVVPVPLIVRKGEEVADVVRRYATAHHIDMEKSHQMVYKICAITLSCSRYRALLLSLEIEFERDGKSEVALLEVFANQSPSERLWKLIEEWNIPNPLKTHRHNMELICSKLEFKFDHDCYSAVNSTVPEDPVDVDIFIIAMGVIRPRVFSLYTNLRRSFHSVSIVHIKRKGESIINPLPGDIISQGDVIPIVYQRVEDSESIHFGEVFSVVVKYARKSAVLGIVPASEFTEYPEDRNAQSTDWDTVARNVQEALGEERDAGIYSILHPNVEEPALTERVRNLVDSSLYTVTSLEGSSGIFISPIVIQDAIATLIYKSPVLSWGFAGVSDALIALSRKRGFHTVVDRDTSTHYKGYFDPFDHKEISHTREFLLSHLILNEEDLKSLEKSALHFIGFGDSKRFPRSRKRIQEEAENLGIFDTITVYDETAPQIKRFMDYHHDFFSSNQRGFGYYLWKPFLALLAATRVKPNDVVLYADTGYTLNALGKSTLMKSIDMAHSNDLLVESMENIEMDWTKGKGSCLPEITSEHEMLKIFPCIHTLIFCRRFT